MEGRTSFGQWLKQRRKALDLTQEALARQVGCAAITIRKIEADEFRPSAQIAEQLAEQLELAPEEHAAFMRFARTPPPTPQRTGPAASTQPPPDPPYTAHPHNLPVQRDRLIGREQDVAAARALLLRDDVGLVTLTGPGGTGKTRLALAVAAELLASFPDGVWFVALAPITDPALVLPTIVSTLGIKEAGGQPLIERLTAYLREKHLLLLLDNFEQVVAAASVVAQLLAGAPQLTVLATSRTPLGIYGEYTVSVAPLALPDPQHVPPVEQLTQYAAIQLFITRAQAASSGFALTGANANVVAEICQRVDGLPLALELAAARLRHLPPQALLARLSSRLQLLTGGPRTLPARQQTLRNTIAWSYDLLNPDEQRLFRRLAVFVGGWTLEAAEAVCNREGHLGLDVLAGLASLIDKSLVRHGSTSEAKDPGSIIQNQRSKIQNPAEPRFTMLETIREYAAERLAASCFCQSKS